MGRVADDGRARLEAAVAGVSTTLAAHALDHRCVEPIWSLDEVQDAKRFRRSAAE